MKWIQKKNILIFSPSGDAPLSANLSADICSMTKIAESTVGGGVKAPRGTKASILGIPKAFTEMESTLSIPSPPGNDPKILVPCPSQQVLAHRRSHMSKSPQLR